MATLTEQDFYKILQFLQGLYASTNLNTFSTYVRKQIPELVSAEVTVYGSVNFETQQVVGQEPVPYIPNFDETVKQHFYENPFTKHYLDTFDFSAYKLSDFLTNEELHRSEAVYQKFMRHLEMEEIMLLSLPHSSVSVGKHHENSSATSLIVDTINLFRSERSFTERDRTILNVLQPHLMQARQTAQAFSQLMQEKQELHDCLNTSGSIVIGKEGRIKRLTQKAECLLKQYFPTFNQLGYTLPERLKQWVNYQRSLISKHNSALKPLSPLKIEQGDRLLNVRFAADPGKDQYMLLLSEQKSPSLSIELLATLGLSTREAEILFWVMDGKTNAEIADTLYLSISTVRKHLEHIYLKLGAHTRAGAVVKAFRQLGVLNLDCSTTMNDVS